MSQPNVIKRPLAAIIDLDGTLLDTVPDLSAAANAVRADFGLPALPQARIAEFVGKGAQVLMHRALSDSMYGQIDPGQLERAMNAFEHHYQRENGRQARIYEGVLSGLTLFRAAQIPLACVTNKPFGFAKALLEKMEIASFFSVLLGGDSLPEKKPHPAPMLEACRCLSVAPETCLAIGDSGNDVLAARAAKMQVVVVPYGYTEGMTLESFGADAIVQSIEAAARLACLG